jgi:hypothetical protein
MSEMTMEEFEIKCNKIANTFAYGTIFGACVGLCIGIWIMM